MIRSLSLAAALLLCLAPAAPLLAQAADLIDPDAENGGWLFHDGREFPGAKGSLEVLPKGGPNQQPALALRGDFSGGGAYVAMHRSVPKVTPELISMWVRAGGASRMTLRLVDARGTTHQIRLKLQETDKWQRLQFPVRLFFRNMGQSNSLPMVQQYESWGPGKKDGWQPPLTDLAVILGRHQTPEEGRKGALIVSDLVVHAAPDAPAGGGEAGNQTGVTKTVRLDEVLQAGYADWTAFRVNAPEPKLTVVEDADVKGKYAVHATASFPKPRSYVGFVKTLADIQASQVQSVDMQLKTSNVKDISFRVVDGSGQTHQRKGIKLTPDGKWHAFSIKPNELGAGEHWGGANDGKVHQPIGSISLLLNPGSADGDPELSIADVSANVTLAARAEAASYSEDFEDAALPESWQGRQHATLAKGDAIQGEQALRLERGDEKRNEDNSVLLDSFAVRPGPWVISGATRAKLHSPDTSFNGSVDIEWLNGGGAVVGKDEINRTIDQPGWKTFRTTVNAPKNAVTARLVVRMRKTYGWFEVDNLEASQVSLIGKPPKLVERIHIASPVLGNLFLPEDAMSFEVRAMSTKPLDEASRTARWEARDYWGAEYLIGEAKLEPAGRDKGLFAYAGQIVLDPEAFGVGKFYELHVTVKPEQAAATSDYRGFARLPKPASHAYDAMAIPFGLRNWDPRVGGWLELGNRIGLRKAGAWTAENAKNPQAAKVLGTDRFSKLDMKAMAGSRPVAAVERDQWAGTMDDVRVASASAARDGGDVTPMFCLGNEPHISSDADVQRNLAAYKAAYEGYKSVNPDIVVIGPSIGATEAYFKAGVQNYCDTYDFHTYESYKGMPRRVQAYIDLAKKYGAEKPIYCTEMGLNAQGQTRYSITLEMLKKIPVFFAAGGAHASWFTINYPDPKGKARGNSGDAFCMFDSTFNEYNPRLDAIGYYIVINTILDKKSVGKVMTPDATEAYLFANEKGECLQVIWNDKQTQMLSVPLPGVESVRLVRVDGSEATLKPRDGAVSLFVSAEPVYLLYNQAKPTLAEAFPASDFRLAQPITAMVRGEQKTLRIEGEGVSPEHIRVQVPPRWVVDVSSAGADAVEARITPPVDTDAREGRVLVQRLNAEGAADSELCLTFPLSKMLEMQLSPRPGAEGEPPAIMLSLENHGAEPIELSWALHLEEQYGIAGGKFELAQPKAPTARLTDATAGTLSLAGGEHKEIVVPIADTDHQTLYKVAATATDVTGESFAASRLMGGWIAVKPAKAIKVDGRLDEPAWATAPVAKIAEARQYYGLRTGDNPVDNWDSPEDLSATLRFLWDDQYLYVGVEVTDDHYSAAKSDSDLWAMDGLQFLIDPSRTLEEKPGKYDYSLGTGTKGPQVWRHVSASPAVASGEAKDVQLASERTSAGEGGITYEIAFPWKSLAPFDAKPGANLGLTMILNEDDGNGRRAFMGWFGGAHAKLLHSVGDLILVE